MILATATTAMRIRIAAIALAALASCAPIRLDHPAEPSYAFDRPQETTLGRAYAAEQAAHPGLSAFRLINNGSSALVTRGALADLAERSIDLQYYLYDADDTGAFVADRLLAAANRGVRVRMILDDFPSKMLDATFQVTYWIAPEKVRSFVAYEEVRSGRGRKLKVTNRVELVSFREAG